MKPNSYIPNEKQ